MKSTSINLNEFKRYLYNLKKGEINDKKTSENVVELLANAWDDLDKSIDDKTTSEKIKHRAEKLQWNPPVLQFMIERHGAVARGSIRAELLLWEVNVETGKAEMNPHSGRYKEIGVRQPRYKPEKDAESILSKILNKNKDEWLTWKNNDTVRINIGKIIPYSGPKDTVTRRRRRLGEEIQKRLESNGWELVEGTSPHTYKRKS